ncbi:MAG TPA: phytanoyl-CoA dioxygenase family protein [Pyrinomonadaceae bacterium]|jgi:ectoine hydroxylase-related dioxygenase (phytanoyl-CoA dioxygenase family)|nr:phytanoyl-CoA dioxygenase family protein [Pyrinomonadaceae bacterium]
MQQTVKTFGVKEFSRPESEVERHAEEIRLAGYTVLSDVLTPAELEEARAGIGRVYQTQIDEIGGREHLEAIGDTYTAMCLLAYDEFFLALATKPRVLAVVEEFLGDYYTLMLQNGIINVPEVGDDQTAGYWHRDLGYQHFTSSRPLGVTALYCIDDFSAETGGTRVLPCSHRAESFPSEEYVRRHELGVAAPAGSAIVFDSMLYHRGGHNRSGRVRRGINNIYTLPLIRQQISLPSILGGRHSDDPFLRKLLGYENETDADVLEFRRRRLRRARGA